MNPEDILRILRVPAAGQGQAAGAINPQQILQALLTALLANAPPPPKVEPAPPPPSGIDNALGGQALTGKKTMLAVLAYALMSILQSQNMVGTATGPEYKAPPAAISGTAAPAAPATLPATTTAPGAAVKVSTDATGTATNGRTPTGVILTTLIAAFGGLGFIAKIDRGLKALSMAADIDDGK